MHFSVAVLTREYPTRKILDEVLAPYQELVLRKDDSLPYGINSEQLEWVEDNEVYVNIKAKWDYYTIDKGMLVSKSSGEECSICAINDIDWDAIDDRCLQMAEKNWSLYQEGDMNNEIAQFIFDIKNEDTYKSYISRFKDTFATFGMVVNGVWIDSYQFFCNSNLDPYVDYCPKIWNNIFQTNKDLANFMTIVDMHI